MIKFKVEMKKSFEGMYFIYKQEYRETGRYYKVTNVNLKNNMCDLLFLGGKKDDSFNGYISKDYGYHIVRRWEHDSEWEFSDKPFV